MIMFLLKQAGEVSFCDTTAVAPQLQLVPQRFPLNEKDCV